MSGVLPGSSSSVPEQQQQQPPQQQAPFIPAQQQFIFYPTIVAQQQHQQHQYQQFYSLSTTAEAAPVPVPVSIQPSQQQPPLLPIYSTSTEQQPQFGQHVIYPPASASTSAAAFHSAGTGTGGPSVIEYPNQFVAPSSTYAPYPPSNYYAYPGSGYCNLNPSQMMMPMSAVGTLENSSQPPIPYPRPQLWTQPQPGFFPQSGSGFAPGNFYGPQHQNPGYCSYPNPPPFNYGPGCPPYHHPGMQFVSTYPALSSSSSFQPELTHPFPGLLAIHNPSGHGNWSRTKPRKNFQPPQPKKLPMCGFCKSNRSSKEAYRSHDLRDASGKLTCPILRNYTCPKCGKTGDDAHTIKYCPESPPVDAEADEEAAGEESAAESKEVITPRLVKNSTGKTYTLKY